MAALIAVTADDRTRRYLGPQSTPADQFGRLCRNAGSWLLYGYGSFVVRPRGSDTVIGSIGVFHSWRGLGEDFDDQAEAGWILHHDWVGQGLAEEAMREVLRWFSASHGKRRIVCMISEGNKPSIRMADKLGFRSLRSATLPDGDAVLLFERTIV